MNTMRTISRVLVVATVAFVGSASAMDAAKGYGSKVGNAASSAQFRVAFAYMADETFAKDDHAKKALTNTVGFALDRFNRFNHKNESLNLTVIDMKLAEHLIINYALRVAVNKLDKAGLNAESTAKVISNLTGDRIAKSTAQTAVEYATHPEVLMVVGGILYGLIPTVEASK